MPREVEGDMPVVDPNVPASGAKSTGKDQGRITVSYRGVDGYTQNAITLGRGSSSGLKLLVSSGPSRRIVDNVQLATSLKQTNVYFFRIP